MAINLKNAVIARNPQATRNIKRHRKHFAIIILILTTTSGCTLRNYSSIRELNCTNISYIRYNSIANPPPESKGRDNVAMLKIEIETPDKISEIARKKEYNTTIYFNYCNHANTVNSTETLGYPYLYAGNDLLRDIVGGYAPEEKQNSAGKYTYTIYLSVSNYDSYLANPKFTPYNLLESSQGICLHFHGGNMLGMHSDSKSVFISRNQLNKALEPLRKNASPNP